MSHTLASISASRRIFRLSSIEGGEDTVDEEEEGDTVDSSSDLSPIT